MRDWLKAEPIVLMSGKGAVLRDVHGREYLDANASIWTNLHGHAHPKINAAIRQQLTKVAHTSALGFASEPASLLAEKLVLAAWLGVGRGTTQPALGKVFFSDNGSTARDVALKLAYECGRRSGRTPKPRFLSLAGAYHGDTVGAVSLGHIDLFHKAYGGLLFKSDQVMAPYCYRCAFNRAKPERADARQYRQCDWECLGKVKQCFHKAAKQGRPYTGFVFEPLMQGAAGMIPQPDGWLSQAAGLAREHGAMLIADEIMTGFGRAIRPTLTRLVDAHDSVVANSMLFACHQEGVQPDFLCLAKGLSGGYLPMAATLTTQAVFDAFLGEYREFRTFFHGHTYTGNQLASAASLASLDLLEGNQAAVQRAKLGIALREALAGLWSCPFVGDVRQVGLVAGVELVRDWRTRKPFALTERVGIRVCEAMARRGVLTRPVGSVLVLMPPYCTTRRQVETIVGALRESLREVLGA
jgi:adenosylmethionine-8-amino-7-oxononanoate aminotransferase